MTFGLYLETEYRKRRSVLASLAKGFRNLDPVPIVTYTEEENKTWGLVYNRLLETQGKYACAEYLSIMPLMQAHCGYCAEKIPQVISDYFLSILTVFVTYKNSSSLTLRTVQF
jgi:hypothetical protein